MGVWACVADLFLGGFKVGFFLLLYHVISTKVISTVSFPSFLHSNPTPGVVINRPGGPNVYTDVPKDYTGKDVTPENFLKVLQGDAEGLKGVGSGKVLKSGPNDRVFINLVDHGAPGIFGFPVTFLYVKDFISAIQGMHRNKQYKEVNTLTLAATR